MLSCLRDNAFSRFDRTPVCDRQTDRQTDRQAHGDTVNHCAYIHIRNREPACRVFVSPPSESSGVTAHRGFFVASSAVGLRSN